MKNSSQHGFTLMEIMIVAITLGVIASLALSNYNKVMEQNYCRNAQMNLIAIHNAIQIFYLKNRTYHSSGSDLTAINTDLNLNINDPYFTYSVVGVDPNNYSLTTSTRKNGPTYSCTVSSTTSLQGVNVNPTCTSTNFCPSVLP